MFNALPGDSLRNGSSVNSTDYLDVRGKVGNNTGSTAYSPYYDVLGTGSINSTSYLDVRSRVGQSQAASSNAPGPQDSGVGGLTTTGDDADLSGAMLAVQEGSTGQTGGGTTGAAVNPVGTAAAPGSSESGVSFQSAGNSADRGPGVASATGRESGWHRLAAADRALADFELTDLWV